MKSCKKFRVMVLGMVLFFLWTTPCPALDDAGMVIDALVVRPLGVGATLAGTAVFIVALPFSILSRSVGKTADKLVVAPACFTFTRPLGEFKKEWGDHMQGLAFTQGQKSGAFVDNGQSERPRPTQSE